jgi:hypothetical protein
VRESSAGIADLREGCVKAQSIDKSRESALE